jgi:hypothetical protein
MERKHDAEILERRRQAEYAAFMQREMRQVCVCVCVCLNARGWYVYLCVYLYYYYFLKPHTYKKKELERQRSDFLKLQVEAKNTHQRREKV